MNLKELIEALESKKSRLDEISRMSTEEYRKFEAEADTLSTEVDQLIVDIKAVKETSEKQARLIAQNASVHTFLNEPAQKTALHVPATTEPRDRPLVPAGTTVTGAIDYGNGRGASKGMYQSGLTRIQFSEHDTKLLSQEGEGLYSSQKMDVLNSDEYKMAYVKHMKTHGYMERLNPTEQKVLMEGLDDSGGFWVPPDWTPTIIDREPTPTVLNTLVESWNTNSDRKVFPKNAYTGQSADDANANLYTTGMRVTYAGETTPSQSTYDVANQPIPGQTEIIVYTAMLALDVSLNQLEDTPLMLMAWIQKKFGETIDLEYDNRILNGTGAGQAKGILVNPTTSATSLAEPQYTATGQAGAITADSVKSLPYSVAPQYITGSRFVMNWMTTAQQVDLLKDGTGRYLWSQGQLDNGLSADIMNRRLLGFPVSYSEFMPACNVNNNYGMLFGNLSGYFLVKRIGFSIQVLRELKYKQGIVELVGRLRFGGQVVEPWKLRLLKSAVS